MTKFFGNLHNHPKNSKLNIKFVEKYDKTYFKNSNSKHNSLEGSKNKICQGETVIHDRILWAQLFDRDTVCRIPIVKW